MHMKLLVVAGCCTPAWLAAQDVPWRSASHVASIPQAELDAITARGRRLADYDAAAWRATDLLLALQPEADRIQGYVARPMPDGRWEVVFGKQNAPGGPFLVAYRVIVGADSSTSETRTFDPPFEDRDYFARAAAALDVGQRSFGDAPRPYNAAVLPVEGSSEWWVYLLPAQTRMGVYPHGGDIRYRVSADGRSILEQRRMHNAILEFGPLPSGQTPEAGTHTAVLADRPEDTDVFYVLTRTPRLREYIVTTSFFFRVGVDGRIAAYDREPR